MLSVRCGVLQGECGNGSGSCCQLTAAGRQRRTEDWTPKMFLLFAQRRCLLKFNEVFTSVWHLAPPFPFSLDQNSVGDTNQKRLQWSGKNISANDKIAINFPMPRATFSCLCSENLSPTVGEIRKSEGSRCGWRGKKPKEAESWIVWGAENCCCALCAFLLLRVMSACSSSLSRCY